MDTQDDGCIRNTPQSWTRDRLLLCGPAGLCQGAVERGVRRRGRVSDAAAAEPLGEQGRGGVVVEDGLGLVAEDAVDLGGLSHQGLDQLLVERAASNQVVREDGGRLPDPVEAVLGLAVDGRRPVEFGEHHV